MALHNTDLRVKAEHRVRSMAISWYKSVLNNIVEKED